MTQILDEVLRKAHNPDNEDWYPGGSFYLMKSETEDLYSIVRPTQPPIEAFASPFLSWSAKEVFEHFKATCYEPFKDMDSSEAPKTATFNCVILDEQTCLDRTCLLVSDTPAGDLYDKDLPHTARCELGFALCVLGDCEIMNGDLVEYSINYGDNTDHVLRDDDKERNQAGEEEDSSDEDDDSDLDGDENEEEEEEEEGEEDDDENYGDEEGEEHEEAEVGK